MLPAALLCALLVHVGFATTPAAAQAARCPNPGAIGLSRTVEIDATSGPLFGTQQYQGVQPLADGEIVLTFDDGPLRRFTQAVMDALDRHCTKATFFLVGRMAIADPQMVQELHRRGHTIATHTWSHANLKSLSPQAAAGEIELGFSAVQKALGKPIAPFFRFPYLSDPKSMISHLQGRGIGIFSIDIDAYDYRAESGRDVQRRILKEVDAKGKGILLFHDIQRSTAEGLPGLLDELARRRLKVVHFTAKRPVSTIASYDAEAARLLERRNIAARATPLADRAVTWPVASPGAAGAVITSQPAGPANAAIAAPVAIPGGIGPDPSAAPRPVVIEPREDWRERALRGNN